MLKFQVGGSRKPEIWCWTRRSHQGHANSRFGDGGVRHARQIHPSQVEEGAQLQADGRRRINSRLDFVVISKLLSNLISSTTKTYQPIKTNLKKFYSKIKHTTTLPMMNNRILWPAAAKKWKKKKTAAKNPPLTKIWLFEEAKTLDKILKLFWKTAKISCMYRVLFLGFCKKINFFF